MDRDSTHFVPPANPTSHIELLDFRNIWDKLSTAPSMKAVSEELGIKYSKITQLHKMLNHYFEEGALDDWLRVTEELGSIQKQRSKNFGVPLGARFDHRDDRLLMELRQVFVEYIRDPVNHQGPPPTNEDIQWVYRELLAEEEKPKEGNSPLEDEEGEVEPTSAQPGQISEIINSAGSKNFPRAQGAWGKFEQACEEITGFGWKMGMCKASSGKDNAVNRMYTTGAIRSYPETLIHCLFIDGFIEEMTEVYRNEFGSKLRSSPIMVLVQKRRQGRPWRATRVLVQHRHPLLPLNRHQIEEMFPNAEVILTETTPFELTEGWIYDDLLGDLLGDYTLKETLEEILELQKSYSSSNTEEMKERGRLVRKVGPRIVRNWISDKEIRNCQGSDGVGRKTRIPWFRVFHPDHSPSATTGWYLVYLFAFDGSAVYLSLNQGTTRSTGKQFEPRSPEEINKRVSEARKILKHGEKYYVRTLVENMEGALRDDKKLARGYESGNVYCIPYKSGQIPDDNKLRADLLAMMTCLQKLHPTP